MVGCSRDQGGREAQDGDLGTRGISFHIPEKIDMSRKSRSCSETISETIRDIGDCMRRLLPLSKHPVLFPAFCRHRVKAVGLSALIGAVTGGMAGAVMWGTTGLVFLTLSGVLTAVLAAYLGAIVKGPDRR